MAYQILTDSSADLTAREITDAGVQIVPLVLHFRGQELRNPGEAELRAFYAALRAGEPATTSAANPEDWAAVMEPVLQAGEDVLVLAFSSGLSTTCQSARIAAGDLQETYPDRKILVSDTLCASRGQGLLVWYAARKRQEGMDIDTLDAWAEETKLRLCHWFTVDDLMFLKRGGRISATTAVVGSMLNIKPVLHVDDEGHLINVGKVRGRKASLDALVRKAEELGDPESLADTVFLCHGDCVEDAEYVAARMKEKFGTRTVSIGYTGAVIGAHSGPGTLALFFLGKHR